jgi:hypothetical protein
LLLAHRPEAKLISGYVDKIGQLSPQLITFNEHSIDLAVCNAILQRPLVFSRPGAIS